MKNLSEQLHKAFKKLKASVYFDKTQLVLRDKIVRYEKSVNLSKRFKEIALMCEDKDDTNWQIYVEEILSNINVLVFPKILSVDKENRVILNASSDKIKTDEVKHFIDLDVEGQILGIIWILTIGLMLDNRVSEHSYGNRLKKSLEDEKDQITYSPYLFKPYFSQYESWRDIGLSYAEKHLDNSQDAIIFTMDLTRFFYSLNFTEDHFKEFFEYYKNRNVKNKNKFTAIERINLFVFKVLQNYSKQKEFVTQNNVFLPIGFYPSNILSNWYLNDFDSAISNTWNPVYYGRYVDDILIVDKIEKNSAIYQKVQANELKQDDVINYYLCHCSLSKEKICEKNIGLLTAFKTNFKNKETVYKISGQYAHGDNIEIEVQNKKVKVFYLKAGGSKAILTNFRNTINENKSEFRYLPDENIIFEKFDYSEIIDLKQSDSINKFRSIDGFSINKFSLSKFLGKYRSVSYLIKDQKEYQFEKNLLKIFDASVSIENYIFWERVMEIFVLNSNFYSLSQFITRIVCACAKISLDGGKDADALKITLMKHLYSSYVRVMALSWGVNAEKNVNDVVKLVNKHQISKAFIAWSSDDILTMRQNYCLTRMCNKYVMPGIIDAIISKYPEEEDFRNRFNDSKAINLFSWNDFIEQAKDGDLSKSCYKYYPYIVAMRELEMYSLIRNIYEVPKPINFHCLHDVSKLYWLLNYPGCKNKTISNVDEILDYTNSKLDELQLHANRTFSRNRSKATKYKIAIASL